MKHILFYFNIILFLTYLNSTELAAKSGKQDKAALRTLAALVDTKESGWPIVLHLKDSAQNEVLVLPVDTSLANTALFQTQVTIKSSLGAIIYHTGGIIINNGWLRILGSGDKKMKRSVPSWNLGKTIKEYGEVPPYLLIADDVIGGFFALNGGGLDGKKGNVFYFSPEDLSWQDLGIGYTDFIEFCFKGDLDLFYKGMQWKNFENDLKNIDYDDVVSFSPPLWSKEGSDLESNKREIIPIDDLYIFYEGLLKSQKSKQ